MLYPTTYTTVCSNSAFWQNNASVYNTYNSLSSKWISLYKTFDSNVQSWDDSINGYNVYSNLSQEYTKQKTFSAVNIKPENPLSIVWDLSSGQVATYTTSETSYFSGFRGEKRGGIYHLMLITDATCLTSFAVTFNRDKFKFPNWVNTFSISGIHLRKFEFLCDGTYLHGKQYLFDLNPPESDIYYSGNGILLFEDNVRKNFLTFEGYDSIYPVFGGGVDVVGSKPYVSGDGIIIQAETYNNNYVFVFNTLSSFFALPPYDAIGSQDRINMVNPNLTATNVEKPNNTLQIQRKCGTFDSIDIITKAYGYISELLVDNIRIDDYVFRLSGYENHETGHTIYYDPNSDNLNKTVFVKFGEPVPIMPTLSSGISLWLDAMDYSSVDFTPFETKNYITGLSSKVYGSDVYFTSVSAVSSIYDLRSKQAFNYNSLSTHYRDLVLSGKCDFVTFTVFTPSVSSSQTEWLWANGDYGIFKIPNSYSIGVGTISQYYEYSYGFTNRNIPLCVATRCLSSNNSQVTFVNGSGITSIKAVSSNFNDSYTMFGGLNPTGGYSKYKLHECILYKGSKTNAEIGLINSYLVDKWKIRYNVPIETPTPTPTPTVTPTVTPTLTQSPTPTPTTKPWILEDKFWNDNYFWVDGRTWMENPPTPTPTPTLTETPTPTPTLTPTVTQTENPWILMSGIWDDNYLWVDAKNWID
jgi:hypothetical protein